jgi:Zn-dependent M28 family amino/carboxypeptidase
MHSDSARLESLVRGLALPEGRRVGRPGHRTAEKWVEAQFKRLALMPHAETGYALPYTSGRTQFTNFAAIIPGRDQSLAPLLLGAHYDSVIDAPCADDNAASVALTLEIASRLKSGQLRRDVIIALFDAEEPPYFLTEAMGSIRFYENQTDRRGFHAALISDLIGHDVGFRSLGADTPEEIRRIVCVLGAESHPALPAIIDATPTPSGLAAIALRNSYAPDLSDHQIFRVNHHPYLFLSCGHWPHYHKRTDTPDRLNYTKLAAITDWTHTLLLKLADASLPPHARTPTDADSTAEFEAARIARAIPSDLLKELGLTVPTTRAGVDAFVGHLLRETYELG